MSEAAPFQSPGHEYTGIHAGPWELLPSLFAGVAFNDNIYQTTSNRVFDYALRTTPTFVAINNSGINNFTAYGVADSYVYARHGDADTVNGRVGIQDIWKPEPDLSVRLSVDASRNTDTTDSGQIVGGSTVLPVHYWQYQVGGSVLKSFGRFFVGLGGNFVNSTYEDAAQTAGSSISQAFRDVDVTTISGRAGYYIGPAIYGYTEVSGNNQSYYNAGVYSSDGYRVVGGLGTDRISLFRGEVYGGYQEQFYKSSVGGTIGGATFGGKVYWYPTEYLTFTANVGESLGTSVATSISASTATATNTTSASVRMDYALAQIWSAGAHIDYSNARYSGSSRVDNDYAAGLTLNRKIWQNLNATADYQLTRVQSNFAGDSYTQNVFSLGLTYKY